MKQNISLAIPTPLERSGQPLSESIDEKSGRWGLFEKTPKLHFLHPKIIFEVRIKPLCDYTFRAGPDLMWSSSWASNSDDFPFFWILYCSSRTQVTAVWKSVNICWNFSHTGRAGSQTHPMLTDNEDNNRRTEQNWFGLGVGVRRLNMLGGQYKMVKGVKI